MLHLAKTVKVRKGIYYFPTYEEAEAAAQAVEVRTDRIIPYEIGWAVQLGVSGPYWGPMQT